MGIELTPAQQDYLETVYHLTGREAGPGVRVTDMAAVLGTKPPTVVRSVARLKQLRLLSQEERGRVHLTRHGFRLAAQLSHRHEDVVRFLAEVLGVEPVHAGAEACLIEHGLSGGTAERLHLFLERWDELPKRTRAALGGKGEETQPLEFTLVGRAAGAGGRR
ncbi:metal-dependent transcriptional regulator [bacterium]|nr:metal-dependent transcriptional regulator [bacterium]